MAKLKNRLQAANSRFQNNGKASGNGHSNGIQAAADPFRTIQTGYSYGFNNTLIEAAVQTPDRQQVNYVDYDFHRVVSVQGRRTLLSLARTMYWRIPALQAAIREQAALAVVPFTPIFLGKNDGWGETALDWLNRFHNVMDLQNWPYSYESYCENLIIMGLVDGDIGTLLTEDASGNPRIQTIGSHRIGSRYQTGGSARVKYSGNQLIIDDEVVDDNLPYTFSAAVEWDAPIIDGSILDDYGRAIAHRVYDDPVVASTYRDISARNLFLSFLPEFTGQVRGYSGLSSSVFDWQDWREWRRLEMLAQKGFASRGIIEENETGYLDESKQVVTQAATFDSTTNAATAPAMVKMDGGAYTVFKAGTNSKLTAFNSGDRPSRTTQDFLDQTLREAMRGTEWDAFFSLDPAHVGGAPMRVIVDRVNRTIKKRRRLAGMSVLRVDVYALSKAIKNGEIPFDPEWYKWTYRGQADVTADRRYDSQTDLMEYQQGWITQEDIQARRQGNWLQKREQREKEADDKMTRAEGLVKNHPDCSFQEAMAELGMTGTVGFTMSRKDQSDESLGGDPNEPGQSSQQEGDANNNSSAKSKAINKAKGKKAVLFIRDANGKIIGAREA
jgi:hypothetical protein